MHYGDAIQAPRKPRLLDDLSRVPDRGAGLLCPYASELPQPHTPPLLHTLACAPQDLLTRGAERDKELNDVSLQRKREPHIR